MKEEKAHVRQKLASAPHRKSGRGFQQHSPGTSPHQKEQQCSIRTSLLGLALSVLLRGIGSTIRWCRDELHRESQHWSEGDPVILVFWHGDQLLMPWSYFSPPSSSKKPIKALVSLHADGRIAAEALRRLSIETIDGSSTRGGSRALALMKRELESGNHVAITPDGPKGPIHEAKIGAALLSSITGAPVLPVALASERSWKLGSWDGMFIPKPFSKVSIALGSPVVVPQHLTREELEQHSQRLGSTLQVLKLRAETQLTSAKEDGRRSKTI